MFKRICWKTGWSRQIERAAAARTTYIGIGVNIGAHGQRLRLLMLALGKMNRLSGTRVTAVSSLYETPPWGVKEQAPFYNCVAAIETGLNPVQLLHQLKDLEVYLGRKHRVRWGPREIDLDIVVSGNLQLDVPGLHVPHRHITEREFVLIPLLEIDPYARLPRGRRLRGCLSLRRD